MSGNHDAEEKAVWQTVGQKAKRDGFITFLSAGFFCFGLLSGYKRIFPKGLSLKVFNIKVPKIEDKHIIASSLGCAAFGGMVGAFVRTKLEMHHLQYYVGKRQVKQREEFRESEVQRWKEQGPVMDHRDYWKSLHVNGMERREM